MFIQTSVPLSSLCPIASVLAGAHAPPSGPTARALLVPTPHASDGPALQKKPGPDQLPGPRSGSGDGDPSKPSREESGGCGQVKAAADAGPSSRAGEKYKRTHVLGHSG